MLIANLYAKQLIVGDHIVKVDMVDHWKFGPLKRFTVERTEEAHAAEAIRQAKESSESDD